MWAHTDGVGHEDLLFGNYSGGSGYEVLHPGGHVYLLPGPLPAGTTTAVDIARARFFTDDGHLNALSHAVELPGDLTGDGQPEIVMSARSIQWDHHRAAGAVYTYPGTTTGTPYVEDAPITLRTVSGNRFGESLAPSGPLDAAGTVDLWVGDGSGAGAVTLFHLATAGMQGRRGAPSERRATRRPAWRRLEGGWTVRRGGLARPRQRAGGRPAGAVRSAAEDGARTGGRPRRHATAAGRAPGALAGPVTPT